MGRLGSGASRAGVDDGGARPARDVGCRARGALGDERGVGTTHSRAATDSTGRHAAAEPSGRYRCKSRCSCCIRGVCAPRAAPTDLKWTRTLPPAPRGSTHDSRPLSIDRRHDSRVTSTRTPLGPVRLPDRSQQALSTGSLVTRYRGGPRARLRLPRCVSTGLVGVRLAEMAN